MRQIETTTGQPPTNSEGLSGAPNRLAFRDESGKMQMKVDKVYKMEKSG